MNLVDFLPGLDILTCGRRLEHMECAQRSREILGITYEATSFFSCDDWSPALVESAVHAAAGDYHC